MKSLFLIVAVTQLSACAGGFWPITLAKSNNFAHIDQQHRALNAGQIQLQERLDNNDARLSQMAQDMAAQFAQLNAQLQRESANIALTIESDKQAPLVLSCPAVQPCIDPIGNKVMLGEIEWISLNGVPEAISTRIDTGATTSSLHATNIELFERDGDNWVRFDFNHPSIDKTQHLRLAFPVVRFAEVMQASSNKAERRPVIATLVKLGELNEFVELSLSDRSQLNYPALLGRNFLRDLALVDVSRRYVQPKFVQEAL